MGIVTSSGGNSWIGIAHGTVQRTPDENEFAGVRWAVPEVVDFAVANGTMDTAVVQASDGHGGQIGGTVARLRNRYLDGQRSRGSPSYVNFVARFGTSTGTNLPQKRCSVLVFSPDFVTVQATFYRRQTSSNPLLVYRATPRPQSAADGWQLYSYNDPCNLVDEVIISVATQGQSQDFSAFLTDYAWDRDARFDRNVVGSSLAWQNANGFVTVIVPNFCLTMRAMRLLSAIPGTRRFRSRLQPDAPRPKVDRQTSA